MFTTAQQAFKIRRWSTWGVMLYMVLALGWWTILLFKKNHEVATLRTVLHQYQGPQNGAPSWAELEQQQTRQGRMILGESVVFILMLILGLYWINRSFKHELDLAKQKQNFLLSISHEFKSPLTAVKLGLETLEKRDLEGQKKKQVIAQALQENERLEKLVESLLLAARIESNYLATPEAVEMPAWLEHKTKELRLKHPDVHLSFINSFPVGVSPTAYVDPSSLSIILDNLYTNAIKYSPYPADIKITASDSGDQIILHVADLGSGIPDHEKHRVTEKFYRSGSEETRRTQGTGLGLYLVNKLCLLNHYSFKIMNNKPRGTRIEIGLPKYSPKHV